MEDVAVHRVLNTVIRNPEKNDFTVLGTFFIPQFGFNLASICSMRSPRNKLKVFNQLYCTLHRRILATFICHSAFLISNIFSSPFTFIGNIVLSLPALLCSTSHLFLPSLKWIAILSNHFFFNC